MIIDGLFIGLSVGASCLASCGPLVMSVIMKNTPTTTGAYAYLFKFMSGRLVAYFLIALLTCLLCHSLSLPKYVIAITTLFVGLMMILNAFFKMPSYCFKGRGIKSFVRQHLSWAYVSILGFISSINVCPPVIAVATSSATSGSIIDSLATFTLFFIGSSLYMLPLPLISLVGDKDALQTIGKFASIIVGVVFIVKALLTF